MGEKRKGVKKGKGGNENEKASCHAPSVAKKKKGREGYQPVRMTAYLRRGFLGGLLSLLGLSGFGLLLRLFLGLFCHLLLLLLDLLLFRLLFFVLYLLAVVSAEEFLDLSIFDLDFIQSIFDGLEANLRVRLVNETCLVLVGAEVLDLLAAVLHLDKAQCGR